MNFRSYPLSPFLMSAFLILAARELYERQEWLYLVLLGLAYGHQLYNIWRIDREEEAEFMRKHTIQD